ncbi:MAG: aminodeoxychorismate synthase component I, partial [Armatimonadota bacterium]|nr:aminodeoxychorismate synthase component I [Armatimonadota bacterium]
MRLISPNTGSKLLIAGALRFDFPTPLCFTAPVRVITAHSLAEARPALCAVQGATELGFYAAGYVAFEAAPAFDPAMRVHGAGPCIPLVWFGIYSEPSIAIKETEAGECRVSDWQPDSDYLRYQRAIAAIRDAIAAGDVYQVNHTFRLRAQFQGDPAALYRRLVAAQRPLYGAYVDLDDFCILSASPELFFRRAGDEITTRPMKGTRPRGRWSEEDDQIAADLQASAKDRAENVMIVDLLRNDLGRIAVPGSVQVPQLFEIGRYPTVLQMTSTVEARLRPKTTLDDIFAALFPCGSVTGAPKISATRLITELETTPRQVYCGAIGYVTPSQEAVFNVAIRTALLDRKTGAIEYGVGGGIVWDSTPEGEYQEAWAKAAVLTEPPPEFDLLETLRWEKGAYWLLERHMERLLSSAAYFRFAVSEDAVREALLAHSGELGPGAWRVRLCLSR